MSEIINNLPWNKKIEVLRVVKGWSQSEAAKKCYTGQKAFWSWESGQVYPRKNSRRAIASAFDVKEEDIFGKEN